MNTFVEANFSRHSLLLELNDTRNLTVVLS